MTPNRATTYVLCPLLLAGLLASGCQEAGPEQPKQAWWEQSDPTPEASSTPGSTEQPRPAPSRNLLAELFTSPTSGMARDGNYTVLLNICRGPGSHVEQAKYYKQATEKHAGWKSLFIVHQDTHSLLYWGKYRTVADARPNLSKAKEYVTPAKIKVFAKAMIVPLPGKEDPGPPEWNLANAPKHYVYTVLRAAFYDVPEADYVGRRQYAVDYCRQLRQQGVPAYFKHDSAQSIVTIGLFEQAAVTLVRKARSVQRIVRDQRIKDVFKRFPHVAVNGRQKLIKTVNAKTGKVSKIPVSTYLMEIPRKKAGHENIIWAAPSARPRKPEPGKAPRDPAGPRPPASQPGRAGGVPRN